MHFIFDNETYSVYIPRQPRSSRGVSGDGPVGGARRGVPRLRLVTNAPGGPGPRPPGTMTWPRGARCTDPEEMPEMEARAPAENRHGGAPRGERPRRWERKAPQQGACVPVMAREPGCLARIRCACRRSPPPSYRGGKRKSARTRLTRRWIEMS